MNNTIDSEALRLRRERGRQRTREWRARGKDSQAAKRAAVAADFAARCAAATAAVEADSAAATQAAADSWDGGVFVNLPLEQAAADEEVARYWDWVAVKGMKRRKARGTLWFKVEWDDRDGGGEDWVSQVQMGNMGRVWDWLAMHILHTPGIVSPKWNKWRRVIDREWRGSR